MLNRRAVGPLLSLLTLLACLPLRAQDPGTSVNITTWQKDDPSACTGGCVYRTGDNLAESTLTTATLSDTTFGQICNYAVDGQIYGQPLVVTNAPFNGGPNITVAYVATMNGTVYAFGGATPCTFLKSASLLGPGETAVNCDNIGGFDCATIAPNVGIPGTPVIRLTTPNPATGQLFAISESQLVNGTSITYYHRLWALDITTLGTLFESSPIAPTGSCTANSQFSQKHIQRPALLLAGDNYLYVAFSMMDGAGSPLPNGMIFAYNAASLTTLNKRRCACRCRRARKELTAQGSGRAAPDQRTDRTAAARPTTPISTPPTECSALLPAILRSMATASFRCTTTPTAEEPAYRRCRLTPTLPRLIS
jgi:hypothetical protein